MSSSPFQPSTIDDVSGNKFVLEQLTLGSSTAAIDAARELLLDYGRFVAAQTGVASFCFGALEQEAAGLPASYLDRQGGAIVAGTPAIRPSGQPADQLANWIGFVAWRSLPAPELAQAWELKRLWIRPGSRGSGLGRALVEAVIQRARSAGKSLILLDTAPQAMASAHRLYCEMGFTECAAYNGRSLEGIVYMHKEL